MAPQSVALGDLDGDGRLDAALAASAADQVVVLFGDGKLGFPRQTAAAAFNAVLPPL